MTEEFEIEGAMTEHELEELRTDALVGAGRAHAEALAGMRDYYLIVAWQCERELRRRGLEPGMAEPADVFAREDLLGVLTLPELVAVHDEAVVLYRQATASGRVAVGNFWSVWATALRIEFESRGEVVSAT